ncbi:MBL fold metallo-hydrolase [Thermogutta sp.]|uniref:MBL fold metallo-hydrolase n=1 Tax=Thermogutta sp. TaxID=1962930 RepID=UPI00322037A9
MKSAEIRDVHHCRFSRRELLQGSLGAPLLLATGRSVVLADADGSPRPGTVKWLTDHLGVFCGPIHVGVLRNGHEVALFDYGDLAVLEWAGQEGLKIRTVFVTHHHREQAWGLEDHPREIEVIVPEDELKLFTHVTDYWSAPGTRWHIYNQHPHHWTFSEPIAVTRTVRDGDSFTWGPGWITVIATPGHTDGAVSYCVDVDGRRVVFCGDLLHGPGQLPDLYSLQKGFERGQRKISDYHGYLGARECLEASLGRVLEVNPDWLITSHGGIVSEPREAIALILSRLEKLYRNYVSTSALRHYFPELFTEFQGQPDQLPFQETLEVPPYLRHIGTTWILISEDGAAFVMDCGHRRVIDALEAMLAEGTIKRVEGLWITHYHDDHVDAIPDFLQRFGCPCYAVPSVASVVTRPLAWRLPCISPSQIAVDHVLPDGTSFLWHEFRLTAFEFPGQTLYHGALLVEVGSDRLFFVGDSFTPSGIDDYCIQNRNFLHDGMGFQRCLELVMKLQPTHMFNCHVDRAFRFTKDFCQSIISRLKERRQLLAQLLPWPDPHFGTDELWLRADPYEQTVKAGSVAALQAIVFNHSEKQMEFRVRAVLPLSWRKSGVPVACHSWRGWSSVFATPRTETAVTLTVEVPRDAQPGRHVVTLDVACAWEESAPQFLLGFAETVIVVE